MGCGSSNLSDEEKAEMVASKKIESRNRVDFKADQRKIKLLLLGAGESGKSTIFKQMKILYGSEGFTTEELRRMRATIYSNILQNMKYVLKFYKESGQTDDAISLVVDNVLNPDAKENGIDATVAGNLKAIWASQQIQKVWERRAEFQVQDSLAYYLENLDRISAENYVPNEQDVLRARIRTSGIIEETYIIDKVPFVMFDVGGQRNERKKWIHCFDAVTAVIFVAAMNEYNQVLYEDASMNRLDEAVILFDEICNCVYFKKTAMILFLNKRDLFREKLLKIPFTIKGGDEARYTDFNGPYVVPETPSAQDGTPEFEECFEATKRYILTLFLNRNQDKSRTVYHHVTCATDTRNVDVVFNSCKDIILQQSLVNSGFNTE